MTCFIFTRLLNSARIPPQTPSRDSARHLVAIEKASTTQTHNNYRTFNIEMRQGKFQKLIAIHVKLSFFVLAESIMSPGFLK